MATAVDRAQVGAGLEAAWSSLDELLATLDDADWARPTPLPGWDVRAVVAHVIGTEAMLLGDPAPEVEVDRAARPHVRNDIGAFNEAWVVHHERSAPAEVLADLRSRLDRRRQALAALDDEAWDAVGFTPAGPDTHGRFMRIRVFDTWIHEQDVRDAVGRPGHEAGPAVDLVVDEMAASLPYVVGKRAGAPDGASVTFELTGGSARTLHVAVDGRAALVDAPDGPATATLRGPVGTFVRLAGGRTTPAEAAGELELVGDATLARRIVDRLNYTI